MRLSSRGKQYLQHRESLKKQLAKINELFKNKPLCSSTTLEAYRNLVDSLMTDISDTNRKIGHELIDLKKE